MPGRKHVVVGLEVAVDRVLGDRDVLGHRLATFAGRRHVVPMGRGDLPDHGTRPDIRHPVDPIEVVVDRLYDYTF